MTSIAEISVCIQTSSDSVPSTPSWLGEVALLISYLGQQGVLSAIHSQVRLARGRFGRDEVIDFLAVLFGYAGKRGTNPGGVLGTTLASCAALDGFV
jgi:hypothetical protein